jgi:hypothetical protein
MWQSDPRASGLPTRSHFTHSPWKLQMLHNNHFLSAFQWEVTVNLDSWNWWLMFTINTRPSSSSLTSLQTNGACCVRAYPYNVTKHKRVVTATLHDVHKTDGYRVQCICPSVRPYVSTLEPPDIFWQNMEWRLCHWRVGKPRAFYFPKIKRNWRAQEFVTWEQHSIQVPWNDKKQQIIKTYTTFLLKFSANYRSTKMRLQGI